VYVANRVFGVLGESCRGVDLGRIGDVDQVMPDTSSLVNRQFVGADIEPAIDGRRIAVDDLAAERFSQRQADRTFAGCGGTENRKNPGHPAT